jgi:hypothetical protein
MTKYLLCFFVSIFVFCESKAQSRENEVKPIHKHSFGLQTGLTLLENPLVFYPNVHLSYSKTIAGNKRGGLAILYQLGGIFLPDVETKFLFSTAAQYKYVSKKRIEANVFFGLNNQLRRLAYDRYQFDGTTLKSKGRYLYQLGPTLGVNAGYKVIKNEKFSLTPFLGVSLTKLNKDYQSNLFTGYKPSVAFGINLNK